VHHFTRTEGKSPEQAISNDDLVIFGGLASGALGDGAGEGLGGGRGESYCEGGGQYHGLRESEQKQLL